MKKKNYLNAMAILMASLLSVNFTSCSSDDNGGDDTGGGYTKPHSITGTDGVQYLLYSVNYISYSYDVNGLLTSYKMNNTGTYRVGEDFTITDPDGQVSKVTLNGKGYITKITSEQTYSTYRESGVITFSYNGDGQMTSYNYVRKEEGQDNGESYSETLTIKASMSYSDGNLVKIELTENGTPSSTYQYTYDKEKENSTRQNLFVFYPIAPHTDFIPLVMIGALGKGPKNLPQKIQLGNQKAKCYYYLNDNGTIKNEILSDHTSSTLNYNYNAFEVNDAETKATLPAVELPDRHKCLRHHE